MYIHTQRFEYVVILNLIKLTIKAFLVLILFIENYIYFYFLHCAWFSSQLGRCWVLV